MFDLDLLNQCGVKPLMDLALQISLVISMQKLEDFTQALRMGEWEYAVNSRTKPVPMPIFTHYQPPVAFHPALTAIIVYRDQLAGAVDCNGDLHWNPLAPDPLGFMRAVADEVFDRLCTRPLDALAAAAIKDTGPMSVEALKKFFGEE